MPAAALVARRRGVLYIRRRCTATAAIMTFFVRALGLIPLPLLYPWGWLAFIITFYLVRWRRGQVERDVALSLPHLSAPERARVVRDSYLHAADTLIEMLWGFGASAQAILRRVAFENPELILRLEAEKKTVVLVTPHFCNWEWLFLAGSASFGFTIETVYQPHRVGWIDRFMVEARSRFGGRPIPREDFVFELMNARPGAHVYSLIADQTPRRHERKHWTKFLGRDTAFYTGADQVTRYLEATVLYIAMHRVARGRYTVRVEVIAEPPFDVGGTEVIMEQFARRAEQAVLACPEDFLWLQKRWKYARPEGE
jgi:KDO2-lipid IV(A) lauroyltransferase